MDKIINSKLLKNSEVKSYLMIMVGISILALGINVYFSPQQLVTGGISGLSIVVDYTLGVPLWITNLVVNLPLFLIAIKLKGKKFGGKSIFSALYLSIALWYTGFIPPVQSDLLIASVFGGGFVGVGIGIVLRAGATTGGTDLLAIIIKHFFNKIPMNILMLCIDSCIICLGLFIFGEEKAMYALISVFIISKIINSLVDGINYSKAVHIISNKSEEISKVLMMEINRGVTGIDGTGMYTGENKKILFVVCSKDELIILQRVVREIDDKAFITISDAREVMGRGFTEPQQI